MYNYKKLLKLFLKWEGQVTFKWDRWLLSGAKSWTGDSKNYWVLNKTFICTTKIKNIPLLTSYFWRHCVVHIISYFIKLSCSLQYKKKCLKINIFIIMYSLLKFFSTKNKVLFWFLKKKSNKLKFSLLHSNLQNFENTVLHFNFLYIVFLQKQTVLHIETCISNYTYSVKWLFNV